jgi:hypothetical protein
VPTRPACLALPEMNGDGIPSLQETGSCAPILMGQFTTGLLPEPRRFAWHLCRSLQFQMVPTEPVPNDLWYGSCSRMNCLYGKPILDEVAANATPTDGDSSVRRAMCAVAMN